MYGLSIKIGLNELLFSLPDFIVSKAPRNIYIVHFYIVFFYRISLVQIFPVRLKVYFC